MIPKTKYIKIGNIYLEVPLSDREYYQATHDERCDCHKYDKDTETADERAMRWAGEEEARYYDKGE